MHKVIEPEAIAKAADLSAPHTAHCLPTGEIMISMLGNAKGDAPGGFLLLNDKFEPDGPLGEGREGNELQLRLLVPAATQRDGVERVGRAQNTSSPARTSTT